ncbi:MAG: SCO family protein [Sphingobacteriales bacterium]|nr:SCO family protein [Sphingobacteriales bacterium]
MSKRGIFYISFFVLLTLGFYFVSSTLIPGFNKRSLEPISKVRDFKFTTQDGLPFTNKDVNGKVYVAEYFFTTCTGICSVMNTNMKKVYEKFSDNPDFLIVSHTCDPEKDTVGRLKLYADSMKVNIQKWIFVTGGKDSLYNMARLSYTIDDPANNLNSPEDDFLHTQFWALVNRQGDVVGIYDGLKQKEIKKLLKDIDKELSKTSNL